MIYFDNAATSRVFEESAKAAYEAMTVNFGNPASLHKMGIYAENYLKLCKEYLSGILACKKDEIILTSGGTEANNIAVFGAVNRLKRSGNKIITSKTEHSSVLEIFKELEKRGFDVVFLEPDITGAITAEKIEKAVDKNTIFISIMLVNNETGRINPVGEIKHIVKKVSSPAIIHSDCTAAFGKLKFNVNDLNVDMLTISGHKVNAPKGVGALYINKKIKINSLVYGGGQEKGIRSGTENVPAIAAFAESLKITYKDFDNILKHYKTLNSYFINCLKEFLPEVLINSTGEYIDSTINISVTGIRSETMLHFLENKDIYVSSGSACSSNSKGVSHVLEAMKLPREVADSSLRISFGYFNTKNEIDEFIKALQEGMNTLAGKRGSK